MYFIRGVRSVEFEIKAKDGAYPCEVTIDEDNGRYMLRNADTSGEVFHDKTELVAWVKNNWDQNQFEDPERYQQLLNELSASEI